MENPKNTNKSQFAWYNLNYCLLYKPVNPAIIISDVFCDAKPGIFMATNVLTIKLCNIKKSGLKKYDFL